MMYCLKLEDKLDGATNFRGMHLYISYIIRVFARNVHWAKTTFVQVVTVDPKGS
jgi:hypothetical protein